MIEERMLGEKKRQKLELRPLMFTHIIYLNKFRLMFELNMQLTYSPQLDNNKRQSTVRVKIIAF